MEPVSKHFEEIKALCRTHYVDEMFAIGSMVKGDFSDASDVDLLVKFKPMEVSGYFDNYMDLKNRLENLFQREVDLIEEQTLKNPVLIRSLNRSKTKIYG